MAKHPFYFLSKAFSYPEQDSMKQDRETLRLLATDFGTEVGKADTSDKSYPLLDMQVEYVRLFINSADGVYAPPYASLYVNNSGMLQQQGYDEALAFYAEAGMEPLAEKESPDHIAYELNFVGFLIDEGLDELLQRFLNKHLAVWYPTFLQRLLDASPNEFYRELGQISGLCLRQIQEERIHE